MKQKQLLRKLKRATKKAVSKKTTIINRGGGGGSTGAASFLELNDTPDSYSGQAGKFPKVNAGATALEFVTLAGGGDLLSTNNLSDLANAATARTNLGLNTTANQTDSTDKRFMTDAQESKLDAITGTNTGDQTTIVGITGTKAQFDTAVTDGNFMYVGDAPTTHSHVISDVTGLQTALDGKQASGSYAAASHTHIIGDVTGLQTALDGKQETLVSATNIKTINGSSVLGSGNLVVSGSYTLVATLASDQATGANTTPVTLTDLVFTYEANSKYRIWAMGRVSPNGATTGCGFQFDLSSAVTAIDVSFFHQLANAGTLSGGHSIDDDASIGVSSGMPGTSTYPVTLNGLLVTAANTGTAQLRFRSEVNAVTTCKSGFTLVVEKIA